MEDLPHGDAPPAKRQRCVAAGSGDEGEGAPQERTEVEEKNAANLLRAKLMFHRAMRLSETLGHLGRPTSAEGRAEAGQQGVVWPAVEGRGWAKAATEAEQLHSLIMLSVLESPDGRTVAATPALMKSLLQPEKAAVLQQACAPQSAAAPRRSSPLPQAAQRRLPLLL